MQYGLTITAVSKEPRQVAGKNVWGCKEADGRWVNLHQDQRPGKGYVQVDLIEKPNPQDSSRIFRDAYPLVAQALVQQHPPSLTSAQGSQRLQEIYPPIVDGPKPEPKPRPTLDGALAIIRNVFAEYAKAAQLAGVTLENQVNAVEGISSTVNTVIMAYAPRDRESLDLGQASDDGIPEDVKAAYRAAKDGQPC